MKKLSNEIMSTNVAHFVWAALFVAILGAVHTSEWANRVYATYDKVPYLYGDMQWFICNKISFLFLLAAIDLKNDYIITKLLIALTFGKIADDFVCPFIYGINEVVFDILMGCIGLIVWLKRIGIRQIITNFVYVMWGKLHMDKQHEKIHK